MAIGIQNYPNIDTSDPTNYPLGQIKDDPTGIAGTPVDVETNGDIHQTFYRSLKQVSITASNTPDNATNGYQYGLAFGLESWQNTGTLTFGALGGGSVTVDLIDIIYAKYQRVGNTMRVQIKLTDITVAGTVTAINITGTPLSNFVNNSIQLGYCNSSGLILVNVGYSAGAGLQLTTSSGAAFTTGTNDVDIDLTIIAEMIQAL
jgi:hypothetical protein